MENSKKITFQQPLPLSDARYLQFFILIIYAVTAREIFNMDRPHSVTLLICLVAAAVDLLISVFKYKVIRFPLAALTSGLSCSLLLDSRHIGIYLLAASLASISRGFILYNKKHYFNPAAFGVVVALVLFPQHVTGLPALFGGFLTPSLIFLAIGLFTVLYAKQLEVALSWILGFIVFAELRSIIFDLDPIGVLYPILGPSFLLFSFHMISDPATTPRTRTAQIISGIVVALFDAIFRMLEIPYGIFYSIVIVNAFLPWVREWEEKRIIAKEF